MRKHDILILGFVLGFCFTPFMAVGAELSPAWKAKVVPSAFLPMDTGELEFFVYLKEQADLSAAQTIASKTAKGVFVFNTLRETAEMTQSPILTELKAVGAHHQSFWIINAIFVRGDEALLRKMARRDDVERIFGNPQGGVDPRVASYIVETPFELERDLPNIPANIAMIHAPEVWDAGFTGQGVVVGHIDTGVQWNHPALLDQYRGYDGESADHNYNWHDAVSVYNFPVDQNGHGTRTMGIIAGYDGWYYRIGVAPGAKWITCRAEDAAGAGRADRYIECLEWMIAPTNLDEMDPDPSKAPHALSHSWLCFPQFPGCDDPMVLQPAIANVRAAGIFQAGGAGNNGPTCDRIDYAPGIYEEMFTVGVVSYTTGEIENVSARGPVGERIEPDATAPAAELTSYSGGGYGPFSPWNSASIPHVVGLQALLISAAPELAGQVILIEDIIERTADPVYDWQECGGVPGSNVPNNGAGWGLIDAYAAFQEATGTAVPEQTGESATPVLGVTPNPFNAHTMIRFDLPQATAVVLSIHDIVGRRLAVLRQGHHGAGEYTFSWDGRDFAGHNLSSGVYFVRLETDSDVQSIKIVLLK